MRPAGAPPDGVGPVADSLRIGAFGRASDEPYHRRGSDAVRLVAGVSLFLVIASGAAKPTAFDRGLYDAFRSLHGNFEPPMRVLRGLGTLWAVGLVASAALVGRRWRLARDLLLAGAVAWGLARLSGVLWIDHVGLRRGLRVLTHRGPSPNFPLVRLTVLVAVVATASPYVGRPMRRAGQILIVGVGASAMYLGTGFPRDIAGGALLGWAIAAAVHLAFGSPGGRPTAVQLTAILRTLGIDATDVELGPTQEPDASLFYALSAGGPIRVKVIGRDEVEAQLLAKSSRFLIYRDAPAPHLSRLHQVEHEACMALLARDAGVAVPGVLYVGRVSRGAVLLVERLVCGPRLADLASEDVDDDLLRQIWQQVANLHSAHISHGALHGHHIVVGDSHPTIVDFSTASAASFAHRRPGDVAELLATTAAIVGDARAVAACASVLEPAAIFASLALLQPAAVSRTTRNALADNRRTTHNRLEELRSEAARVLEARVPETQQLHRVRFSSLLMAVGGLVAVAVPLSQIGNANDMWTLVRHASIAWVTLALILSLVTNVPYAIALIGSVPRRLPFWPTTELQVAMSYSNLAIPSVGGLALQVRFLQRQGIDLSSALAAGGVLSMFGSAATQIAMFLAAIWLAPDSFHLDNLPVSGIVRSVGIGLIGIAVLLGIAFGIGPVRRFVRVPIANAARTIWAAISSGRQLALIVGGHAVTNVMYAYCLLCCLRAFGGALSLWTLLAITTGVTTLSSLVPIPGGATAVGSLGLSGAMAAFGVPNEIAVSAALTNQIVVSYLPAIPGWFATRHMLHNHSL